MRNNLFRIQPDPRFECTIVVEDAFPIGMLAEDRLWPSRTEDASLIPTRDETRQVRLRGLGPAGPQPCAAHTPAAVVVEGNGPFPFDMLRYSRLWPATVLDARAMLDGTGRRTIRLRGIGPATPARWSSFGWLVRHGRER